MDEDKVIGRPYIYEAPSDNTFVVSPANQIIPKEVQQRIIQEQDRLKKQKLFEDNQWIQQVFAAHPNAKITDDLDEYGKPQVVYTDNYGIVRRVSENSLTPSDTTVIPTFSSYDPNSPEAKRREMYERELKRTDPEKWLYYYGTQEQIDNYLGNKAHWGVLENSAGLASLLYGAASNTGRQLFGEGAKRLGQTGLGQTAKVVFNPYTIPGAVTTSAFTAPYLTDALNNGLNVENSIGIGLGVLPYAAPVATKAYNVGKTAVGSLKQTIDNARNYANYLSRVAAYNNRGRLGSTLMPDFSVTEDAAKVALQKVKNAIAKGVDADPNDIKILDTDIGKSILQNETDDVVQQYIQNFDSEPIITPEPVAATEPPTIVVGSEPAAAEESATIIRPSEPASTTIEVTQGPAVPARPKTLAERFWETHSGMFDIKFGRPGKKFGNQRGYYNIISDDNGNIVPNKIGFEGNTFTLTEEGGKPMISGEIRPGDIAKSIREDVYNPKWYSVADQGADPKLGKVRKWFWKPSENLNARVRTNQGDITITGPGVSRTKLSNWALTLGGLGAIGYGVPTIWGLGKSLVSGDSTSERPVIHLFDGRDLYFNQGTVNRDTTAFLPYGGQEWIPIGKMGDGNYGQMHEGAALTQDTQEAMNAVKQNNSLGKASTQRRNNDSIPINQ